MTTHIERLQQVVDKHFHGRSSYRVLEAGCGSMSFLNLAAGATIVGIDISEQQLERNKILSERICGDIMTYDFPATEFDAIVCIDVLEHLDRPRMALNNFYHTLAPGGVMILKLPNLWSIKGLITKYSPHWFHVWVYRTIYGRKDAGRNDTAPFKTFLDSAVSPGRIRDWALGLSMECIHEDYYESGYQVNFRKKSTFLDFCWKLGEWPVRLLSLGKVSLSQTEYIIVVKRP